ncbi:MAG: hypothetical protein ACI8Y7_000889 [Candidatus Woesearchaeota archaeon]|jgi:hypothetical protein
MKFLQKLFAKKVEPEKSVVRFEKLDRWIDMQFKTVLETTLDQLLTNYHSQEDIISALRLVTKKVEAKRISNTRITTYRLAQEYKKKIVAILVTLLEIEKPDQRIISIQEYYGELEQALSDVKKVELRVKETLEIFYATPLREIHLLIRKLQANIVQSRDILNQRSIATYIIIAQTEERVQINRQKKEAYHQAIVERRKLVEKEQHELGKISDKILQLQGDPRFMREKKVLQERRAKFRHSFYELELLDKKSKFEQVSQRIEQLKKEVLKIKDHIQNLGIESDITLLQKKIFESCNVEVEFVE